jgi:hypothetical protein
MSDEIFSWERGSPILCDSFGIIDPFSMRFNPLMAISVTIGSCWAYTFGNSESKLLYDKNKKDMKTIITKERVLFIKPPERQKKLVVSIP